MKAKQEKALEMLITGEYSLGEIAEKLNISKKTLYNWRQSAEFSSELDRRLKIKLSTVSAYALKRQVDMLKSENDNVVSSAAKDLMDRAALRIDKNSAGQTEKDVCRTLKELFNG